MIPFSRKKTVSYDDPLQKPLEKSLQIRYLLFLGLAASPHLIHMDKVFSGIFYFLLIYRGFASYHPKLMPGKKFLLALTIGVIVLFFIRNSNFAGSQGGVALLLLMSGLKMLELIRRRDLHFSVLLGYFTVITVFLHETSMSVALLMLISVIGMTSILIDSSRISLSNYGMFGLKRALSLSLQSLPIALVLFFLFPRISTPLWSFDFGEKAARTGLSDTVRPGTISRLIQSHETAFRVVFNGPVPKPGQRYWRGPVMWHTNGFIWRRNHLMMQHSRERVDKKNLINYTVFLEASDDPWLLLLDLPYKASVKGWLTHDFQMITHKPISETKRYDAVSAINHAPLKLSPNQRHLGLQLPNNITPRMRDLVAQWQQGDATARQIVERALSHFNEQPFVYTLKPPFLGNNPTDEFLFDTRKGFCEHYATSFTLMMRLAGIPSRLVTGYLGGEVNPQSGHMVVRQSDAHAWSEVWLPGEGWVRIDPTAAVAPERIERSLDIEALSGDGDSAAFIVKGSGFFQSIVSNIRWGMDTLNLTWYQWIIGYDRDKQRNFLADWGFDFINNRTLIKSALALAGTIFILIFVFIRLSDRVKPDRIANSYALFCKRLARIGISRPKHEGPVDYQRRVNKLRPDLQPQTDPIFRGYISLVYGRPEKGWKERFIRHVVAFRPKKLPAKN